MIGGFPVIAGTGEKRLVSSLSCPECLARDGGSTDLGPANAAHAALP